MFLSLLQITGYIAHLFSSWLDTGYISLFSSWLDTGYIAQFLIIISFL